VGVGAGVGGAVATTAGAVVGGGGDDSVATGSGNEAVGVESPVIGSVIGSGSVVGAVVKADSTCGLTEDGGVATGAPVGDSPQADTA